MWEHQIPDFTVVGYRFISYDRRAEGNAVDDLEALADHLLLDRFHLVGTAAGGIVAVDYALSHPERLRSLVIANSIFGVQDEEYVELQRRLRPPEFSKLPPEVRELGPSYRAANPEGTARWKALAQHVSPQPTKNRITYAALGTIKAPTLLLTGDADLYLPPSLLRALAARFPKSCEPVVIPECGHSAFWEQPEVFNRTVLDFIAKY